MSLTILLLLLVLLALLVYAVQRRAGIWEWKKRQGLFGSLWGPGSSDIPDDAWERTFGTAPDENRPTDDDPRP